MGIESFRLDGRVAIITGASSGLGVTAAWALGSAGASVVLGARRVDRLSATALALNEAGIDAVACPCDVTQPDACEALVAFAMERFGAVDVLVNNAGIATATPATKESPDSFRSVIETNLMGAYWMAQACGRKMQPGSAIVNVSSILSMTTAELPQAAYISSKAAINGLTRDLAQQWSRRRGIRVNAIAPGWFETEMTAEYSPEYIEDLIRQRIVMGRCGQPDEYGHALLFLASPASSYVTGVVLPVDGGALLT